MELEEGECSCSGDEEREGEQVGEGERCNNEENGAVLSAIQQKLQSKCELLVFFSLCVCL